VHQDEVQHAKNFVHAFDILDLKYAMNTASAKQTKSTECKETARAEIAKSTSISPNDVRKEEKEGGGGQNEYMQQQKLTPLFSFAQTYSLSAGYLFCPRSSLESRKNLRFNASISVSC
jgi:hypothetical protein